MLRSANLPVRAARMLWSQTCLPHWAVKDHIEVFWGTAHRLPRFLPEKTAQVVTIHDLVWKHAGETMRPLSRMMEGIFMPAAIRQADRIVAISTSTAIDIEEEYPDAVDKIRVIYPGTTGLPAPLDFHSLSALGIRFPYILFVGTLEPRKNLQVLLQAYALLDIKTRNETRLVIAGGKGWGGVEINAMIKDLCLADHVIPVGYVNETQLATLYAHARFLAMPSLYEGFGLPLIEAMSFGIPVLTSNRSSLPEVAGDAGVLVDPFNIHSVSEGLSSLLKNHQHRNYLAKKAISHAKRFSWNNAARKMWAVFQEATEHQLKQQQKGEK